MKNLLTIIGIIASTSSFATITADSSQFYFSKGMEEKAAKRYQVAAGYFEKAIGFWSNL